MCGRVLGCAIFAQQNDHRWAAGRFLGALKGGVIELVSGEGVPSVLESMAFTLLIEPLVQVAQEVAL